MIALRKSEDRGHAHHGWLDSRFTFSFAEYHDPEQMGFRSLRVINDDHIEAGRGFGTHGHQDMEIITYVLEGSVAHKDSMGTTAVVRPGEVQRMTAGTGVRHSEFNPSPTDELHLLQIWIIPNQRGLPPGYEQKAFPEAELRGKLRLVADREGRGGAVTIHQDAALYATRLNKGESVSHPLKPGRYAWLHVARGSVALKGRAEGRAEGMPDSDPIELRAGDGAAISDEAAIVLEGQDSAEVLLFDLA